MAYVAIALLRAPLGLVSPTHTAAGVMGCRYGHCLRYADPFGAARGRRMNREQDDARGAGAVTAGVFAGTHVHRIAAERGKAQDYPLDERQASRLRRFLGYRVGLRL